MTETYAIRFLETRRYDINQDAEVVRFTATASNGSWTCEAVDKGARDLRLKRQAFRTYVLQSAALREDPIEFAEEDLEELAKHVVMG